MMLVCALCTNTNTCNMESFNEKEWLSFACVIVVMIVNTVLYIMLDGELLFKHKSDTEDRK